MPPGQLHDHHHQLHRVGLLVVDHLDGQQLHDADAGLDQVEHQRQGGDDVLAGQPVEVLDDEVAAPGDPPFLTSERKAASACRSGLLRCSPVKPETPLSSRVKRVSSVTLLRASQASRRSVCRRRESPLAWSGWEKRM